MGCEASPGPTLPSALAQMDAAPCRAAGERLVWHPDSPLQGRQDTGEAFLHPRRNITAKSLLIWQLLCCQCLRGTHHICPWHFQVFDTNRELQLLGNTSPLLNWKNKPLKSQKNQQINLRGKKGVTNHASRLVVSHCRARSTPGHHHVVLHVPTSHSSSWEMPRRTNIPCKRLPVLRTTALLQSGTQVSSTCLPNSRARVLLLIQAWSLYIESGQDPKAEERHPLPWSVTHTLQ